MNPYSVIYDACILYPAPVRDLLIRMARTDLFRARWTDAIHDEWIRNVLKNRPNLTAEKLQRTRENMDKHVLDSLVTDYESLIPVLELPDPNDRHVLAAAIRCRADAIVTFNLKDFPDIALAKYGIEAIHPDDFLIYQFDLAPELVCQVAKSQRAGLKNPPKSVEEFFTTLEKVGLTRTVAELRRYAALI